MDMSTLLPLLLNTKGGGSEGDTRSALINMLSNNGGIGGAGVGNGAFGGGSTADILSKAMGGQSSGGEKKSGGMDTADLMSMLMKSRGSGNGGGMDMATVMSLANSMKQQKAPRLSGIQPIKEIAPSEILGKLVKYFT